MPDGHYPTPRFLDLILDGIGAVSTSFVLHSQGGVAGGWATLGLDGLVPTGQLPPAATGGLVYKGQWNPVTNTTPTLATGGLFNGTGTTKGDYVVVTVTGTSTAIDGLTAWTVGDWAVSTGSAWQKQANSTGFGSMAPQNANAVAITGGSTTGQTAVGFADSSQITALSTQPDLVTVEAQDTSGNIIAGYSSDGYLHLVGADISHPLRVGGRELAGASDALDVRSAPYLAAGDGVENFCYATTSGTALTIVNYTGNVTLTQVDAATAQLVIVPVDNSGIAFQPYDVGRALYLAMGGGYTLQATVTRFMSTDTVLLAAASITPQAALPATVTWPCFQAGDVGKSIVVDGQGQLQVWVNNVTKIVDPTFTYGQSCFISTISAVTSPVQVTLAAALPFTWTAFPTRLRWGTNDAATIVTAGQAAYAANKRKLYFSGDGRLYLLLGMVTTDAGHVQYVTPQGGEAAAAVNGMLWVGDNARVFACDASGIPQPHHVAQVGSDSTRTADKRIFGRGSFPRCTRLTTINLLITGDSQSVYAPQSQAQAWGQAHQFVQAFKKANPTKTVNVYNVGIGGATYAQLDDPAFLITNAFSQTAGWIAPRPIAGTGIPWYSWVANINQTGVGSPIIPDLVAIFDNGGNDSDSIDGPSMASFINRCRDPALHGDGNGPTDVVLMTDNLAVQQVTTIGNGAGSTPPNVGLSRWTADYSAGLIRTGALGRGLGCVDLAGQVQRAAFGMDHLHRALRTAPGFTATGTPTAPIGLPIRCLDFSFWLSFSAANDAAAWASMQQLDIQLSYQVGNRLMLRQGKNGNLWVGVSTYGNTTATTCTISSGSTALTVAAPTSAAVTFTARLWSQLYIVSGFTFSSGNAGQQIIMPTGDRDRAQRNFIRGYVDPSNVTLHYQSYKGVDYVNTAGTMTIGGVHFMAQDADAQSDVVIFYPDGTIFNTQIVGFSSATSVTLRDAAPQTISGVSTPVFIGRMGTRWFDTGLSLTGLSTTGQLSIDVSRDTAIVGYKTATAILVSQWADIPIERFGGTFYPSITPHASQAMTLDHYYVDEHRPFMPNTTPWELRGMKDSGDNNFFLGGFGGHPSSRLMTDVLDTFLVNQDLGTA